MVYFLVPAFALTILCLAYVLLADAVPARKGRRLLAAFLVRGAAGGRSAFRSLSAPNKVLLGSGAVLVAVTAFTFGSLQPANNVTLPIEVIGPDGTTRSVTVYASDASDVQALYIQAYSIGYPDHVIEARGYNVDKASIRINGGSWVDVNNQNATCEEPEESIGCITGPYHTIRFRIPISKFGHLQNGSNTIDFRFNYASPDVSTGYRILGVELERGDGSDAIDGTEFTWDDPAEWRAPDGYNNESAVQAGRDLWHQRNLLVDHWDGPQIKASCADCHARNGRDLQYFAFSNESIVARSRFHDLSEEQGKQIAAYIRSIELKKEDGSTYAPPGRPWEPPYQPGPTALATRDENDPRTAGQSFDVIDQQYWAAGAGLDWVFDDDAETYPYLFPGGPSYDDVDPEQRKLNMRTLPLALQMPDWNEWLPVHHPLDAFDDFTNPSDGSGPCTAGGQQAWSYYNDHVVDISASTPARDVETHVNRFFRRTDRFRSCNDPVSQVDEGMARTSTMQWAAVKTWEMLHTNALEDLGPELYEHGEPLSWPGSVRVIFNIAPHIIKYPDSGNEQAKGPRKGLTDVYYDTAWYQQQMTLNSGHNYHTGLRPVDWKYHFEHIQWYHGISDHDQMVRYMASYLKLVQSAELAPTGSWDHNPEGWYLRHLTPAWLLHKVRADVTTHQQEALNDVTTNGRCHMTEEVLRLFVNGMTEEPLSEWSRTNGRHGLEPRDFVPTPHGDPLLFDGITYANHFYRMIPLFGEIGVSSDLLYELADWADEAWPNADPSFRDRVIPNTSCGKADDPPADPYEARITAPANPTTLLAPASLTIEADVELPPERSVSTVTFRADGEEIGEATGEPYAFTWEDVPAGSYELSVEVTDDQGTTTTSSPVAVTVIDASAGALSYAYYEGSWTQLPDFDQLTPDADGVATGFDLDVRQRDDEFALRFTGTLTVPETGTYTFYTRSDDGSKLWIDDSLVVDNGGTHALQEREGEIELTAGKYRLTVGYFEAGGGQTLEVDWAGPGFAQEPLPVERISPGQFQTVSLSQGWNLISSRVTPFTTDLDSLFADIQDDIVLVKDGAGNTYVPEYGVNTIGAWDPLEAYMVYVTADRELAFEGVPLAAAETAVPLDAGWNLVTYLPTAPMAVEDAFGALENALVMVKDFAGNVYLPGYDINTIGHAQPGQGYKVYVTEDVTLTYPSETEAAPAHAAKSDADGRTASSGVPSSTVLLLEAGDLQEGTSVSVWSGDQLLNRATVEDGRVLLSVPGDAEATDEREGARPGERLTLKHEQDGQKQELSTTTLQDVLTGKAVNGPIRYDSESFLLASADVASALPLRLEQNYPNPFSRSTTIEYTVPEKQTVRIEVFDALGRRVRTLVDEVKDPGTYTLKLDADALSSGTYFYRLETGGVVRTHQMTVVR